MIVVMLSNVFQVTKYDPADRDEHGRYVGVQDVYSDHGHVEAAYLAAVAAFAEDVGVSDLTIREPEVAGFVNFGVEAPIDGFGLAGLFPLDLIGYTTAPKCRSPSRWNSYEQCFVTMVPGADSRWMTDSSSMSGTTSTCTSAQLRRALWPHMTKRYCSPSPDAARDRAPPTGGPASASHNARAVGHRAVGGNTDAPSVA
jgi:hypothetical protein